MNRATQTAPPPREAPNPYANERGRLALAFQEPLTVAARIRRKRFQASDANEFRRHILHLIQEADASTRTGRYPEEYAKLATYAVVALLDESILSSPGPLREGWLGYPLQQELFGENVAGENFFLQLRDLLARPDSPELADILELYQLCLLLGFKGRYSASEGAEIRGLITATGQRIQRLRGSDSGLAPQAWLPGGETPPVRTDPWIPLLLRIGVVGIALALVLFVVYRIVLAAGASGLRDSVALLLQ